MNKPSIFAALVLAALAMVAAKNYNSSKSNSTEILFVDQRAGEECEEGMERVAQRNSALCVLAMAVVGEGTDANRSADDAAAADSWAGTRVALSAVQATVWAKAGPTDYILVSFGNTIAWLPLEGFPIPETAAECEEANGTWIRTSDGNRCLLQIGLLPPKEKPRPKPKPTFGGGY